MNNLRIAAPAFALFLSLFSPALRSAGADSDSSAAGAQDLVPYALQLEPVLTGLSSPLYVTSAHDGSNRLFIVEQPGRIKVLQPGASTPTVFLDITTKVLSGGERGLLGLAFHPQYPENRRFFINYTRQTDGATVIAEYKVSAGDPNVADTGETVLLVIPQPFANHNGGMIEFGPDGFLYIGMGDGGSANDPGNRAQNIEELLGKMLRIDVDRPNGAVPYSSPPDNPFFGPAAGRDEIYATGFRNPFRWSFDRATARLFAGDVGQGAREEVDIVTRGGNYGWRIFEGTLCTGLGPTPCTAGGFTPPIAEYDHSAGRCSITGGYVYRGASMSLPAGSYIFGDFCTGEIFLLQGGTQSLLMDTNLSISSFGEDEAGEIYVVNLGGTVHRLRDGTKVIGTDTPGLYNPATSMFFLKDTNAGGDADQTFIYGPAGAGWTPLVGDWNGDGADTIGLYNPASGEFFLKDANAAGPANLRFPFGPANSGWTPIAGDWNGDGVETIGLYNPATSMFFLKDMNAAGEADRTFIYGPANSGWIPIAGDWNGDGVDTVGLYNPATSTFFLRDANLAGAADQVFAFGPSGSGWTPLAGNWDGDGIDTVGLYNPATSTFFLKNMNAGGPALRTFSFGPSASGWKPLAGDWNGL